MNEEKQPYEVPKVTVIYIEKTDVISTSAPTKNDEDDGWGDLKKL